MVDVLGNFILYLNSTTGPCIVRFRMSFIFLPVFFLIFIRSLFATHHMYEFSGKQKALFAALAFRFLAVWICDSINENCFHLIRIMTLSSFLPTYFVASALSLLYSMWMSPMRENVTANSTIQFRKSCASKWDSCLHAIDNISVTAIGSAATTLRWLPSFWINTIRTHQCLSLFACAYVRHWWLGGCTLFNEAHAKRSLNQLLIMLKWKIIVYTTGK